MAGYKYNTDEDKAAQGLLSRAPARAILVGVDMPGIDWPVAESLDELEQMAVTAGVTCADRITQHLARPHPGTLLGSGKILEIAELVRFHNCDAVIFDLELSPGQHRTLEGELETQVLDRTALILIIFAQRAHTREGRLQVELAQIEYDLPRLARQWSHLSRQKGSVQQRGEGEKQIEVDRRLLRRQKDQLLEELEHVRTHRQLHRERRKSAGTPVVALVGYTNAGKSTLLNQLANANGLAEDKLFATLDPMTRRTRLVGGQEILLTDTVGFAQRLPTTLVAAFRATLEEVAEADLLVHVVDASSPTMHRQIEAVEQVLEEIGAGGRPMVVALNKVDLMVSEVPLLLPDGAATLPSVQVSALTGRGIEELLGCISEQLVQQFVALDVLIPYDRGDLVALFHQYGTIGYESYKEDGTHLRGHIPANHYGPFAAFVFQRETSKRLRV
jgi:GTP-binding protein HflX